MIEPAPAAVVASLDGRWLALRRGPHVAVTAVGDPSVRGTLELPSADVDLALVGTPAMLAVVAAAPPAVLLYRVPELDLVARLELPAPARIAAITGPRLALLATGGKIAFVRVTARALAMQAVDPGTPVELAVGLERDQVLMSMQRRLEVWDAAVNRPALRLQLQLPAAPRLAGAAKGHLWAFRIGDEDIYLYRLSDGRPFRHHAGAPILGVTSAVTSPYVVIETAGGLVRLNCFAHTLQMLEAPWVPGTAMALVGTDEDATLFGLSPVGPLADLEPWRATVSRSGDESRTPPGGPSVAPALKPVAAPPRPVPPPPPVPVPPTPPAAAAPAPMAAPLPNLFAATPGNPFTAPGNPFATAAGTAAGAGQLFGAPGGNPFGGGATNPFASSAPAPVATLAPNPFAVPGDNPYATSPGRLRLPGHAAPPEAYAHSWRSPFVTRGLELAAGVISVELPTADADSQLDTLTRRFALDPAAQRALIALYALYLVGYGAPPLARVAQIVGDWTEVLGRGTLGALAFLRHRGGTVALRQSVADFLDGRPPRSITLAGAAAMATIEPGEFRIGRDGRADAMITAELAAQLGKIGVCHGDIARGVLEATLHAAAAVSFQAPTTRPTPWPRAASLVLVLPTSATAWIADLPTLPTLPAA